MTVTDSMFAAVDRLLGKRMCAAVELANGEYVIGYREGRDVCAFARAPTWDVAFAQATERVALVDQLVRNTSTDNAIVATAAQVPVRFVRLRRRDLAPPRRAR
jgi:hypothetical protein